MDYRHRQFDADSDEEYIRAPDDRFYDQLVPSSYDDYPPVNFLQTEYEEEEAFNRAIRQSAEEYEAELALSLVRQYEREHQERKQHFANILHTFQRFRVLDKPNAAIYENAINYIDEYVRCGTPSWTTDTNTFNTVVRILHNTRIPSQEITLFLGKILQNSSDNEPSNK